MTPEEAVVQRERTDDHLRLVTERLEQILAATSDAIMVIDRDLRLRGWNRGAEQLYGWSREEVLGETPPVLPAERHSITIELWKTVLERGDCLANLEEERLTRDGRRVPTLITLSPLRDETGAVIGVLSLAKDLSALKAVEEHRRMLSRLDERESLAMDLHDNTIQALHGASLLLSAAERRTDTDLDQLRATARQVREQLGDAIEQLRQRVLDLRVHPRTSYSLGDGLRRLAEQVCANLRLHVELDIDPDLDAVVPCHAIEDLLAIAREATFNAVRHAGATVLRLRVHAERGRLELIVRDNGAGFDTASADMFAGQGLANMSARAQQLHGTLVVVSGRGAGTEVRLEVPLGTSQARG
jgi:PAS domain S-box-containing protein